MIKSSQTRNIHTRVAIEIYPFNTEYPTEGDDSSGTPTILVAEQDYEQFQVRAGATGTNDAGQTIALLGGLVSCHVNRSKKDVEAHASFSMIGSPPVAAIPGSWVIITTISTSQSRDKTVKLMRFIGQIFSMEPRYSVSGETGTFTQHTDFHCREWSSALQTPVRFDYNAIITSSSAASGVKPSGLFSTVAKIDQLRGAQNQTGNKVTVEGMDTIFTRSFNAFELVHLILHLVGSISSADSLLTPDIAEQHLYDVALSMPKMPKSILKRLNLSGVDAANPFNTGFVTVITGIQTAPAYNDGTWNGVFTGAGYGGFGTGSHPSLAEYQALFNNNPPNRPVIPGIAALMASGESAWGLIQNYACDTGINECFTDMLYEAADSNQTNIVARPVIFVRDMPFLMQKLKNNADESLDDWTLYDDLPRVGIPSILISDFKFINTFINSPNFLRVQYQPFAGSNEIASGQAQILGTQKLQPEMARFGGQEHFLQTLFVGTGVTGEGDINIENWFTSLKGVSRCWHSYNYRMGDGQLAIHDDNIPLTCGFNVQFQFGNFQMVGHVEGFSIDMSIDGATGTSVVTSNIQLSRIVQAGSGGPGDNSLDFIKLSSMGNLSHDKPEPTPDPAGDFKAKGVERIKSILQALKLG